MKKKLSARDNIELVKCTVSDEGWDVVEDRPQDYFLRIRNSLFVADIYYSKRGSVRLKHIRGENYYIKWMTVDTIEDMLKNPFKYYRGSYTH
jgi:hypothetical protein